MKDALALSHEERTDKGHMIKWGSDPASNIEHDGSKLKFKTLKTNVPCEYSFKKARRASVCNIISW